VDPLPQLPSSPPAEVATMTMAATPAHPEPQQILVRLPSAES
jgi:hypothetical protein